MEYSAIESADRYHGELQNTEVVNASKFSRTRHSGKPYNYEDALKYRFPEHRDYVASQNFIPSKIDPYYEKLKSLSNQQLATRLDEYSRQDENPSKSTMTFKRNQFERPITRFDASTQSTTVEGNTGFVDHDQGFGNEYLMNTLNQSTLKDRQPNDELHQRRHSNKQTMSTLNQSTLKDRQPNGGLDQRRHSNKQTMSTLNQSTLKDRQPNGGLDQRRYSNKQTMSTLNQSTLKDRQPNGGLDQRRYFNKQTMSTLNQSTLNDRQPNGGLDQRRYSNKQTMSTLNSNKVIEISYADEGRTNASNQTAFISDKLNSRESAKSLSKAQQISLSRRSLPTEPRRNESSQSKVSGLQHKSPNPQTVNVVVEHERHRCAMYNGYVHVQQGVKAPPKKQPGDTIITDKQEIDKILQVVNYGLYTRVENKNRKLGPKWNAGC
ncbi:hypothetical protein ACOME3_008063 [Neoechinorhynchus agilis]